MKSKLGKYQDASIKIENDFYDFFWFLVWVGTIGLTIYSSMENHIINVTDSNAITFLNFLFLLGSGIAGIITTAFSVGMAVFAVFHVAAVFKSKVFPIFERKLSLTEKLYHLTIGNPWFYFVSIIVGFYLGKDDRKNLLHKVVENNTFDKSDYLLTYPANGLIGFAITFVAITVGFLIYQSIQPRLQSFFDRKIEESKFKQNLQRMKEKAKKKDTLFLSFGIIPSVIIIADVLLNEIGLNEIIEMKMLFFLTSSLAFGTFAFKVLLETKYEDRLARQIEDVVTILKTSSKEVKEEIENAMNVQSEIGIEDRHILERILNEELPTLTQNFEKLNQKQKEKHVNEYKQLVKAAKEKVNEIIGKYSELEYMKQANLIKARYIENE